MTHIHYTDTTQNRWKRNRLIGRTPTHFTVPHNTRRAAGVLINNTYGLQSHNEITDPRALARFACTENSYFFSASNQKTKQGILSNENRNDFYMRDKHNTRKMRNDRGYRLTKNCSRSRRKQCCACGQSVQLNNTENQNKQDQKGKKKTIYTPVCDSAARLVIPIYENIFIGDVYVCVIMQI